MRCVLLKDNRVRIKVNTSLLSTKFLFCIFLLLGMIQAAITVFCFESFCRLIKLVIFDLKLFVSYLIRHTHQAFRL